MPATPSPSRLERTQVITSDAVEDGTKSTSDNDKKDRQFRLHYDKLVIAVGCYAQSMFQNFSLITETGRYFTAFGIPGVKEHAYFLKDVRDARAIRSRVLECMSPLRILNRFKTLCVGFEEASQPTLSDVDRRKLLNFCIVGE